MKAKIKVLSDTAKIPAAGSEYAAGLDLSADLDHDIMILPGRCEKISTGLSITPPAGYFGAIFARSGIACNRGLRPSNCVGKQL